jgi:integrase
VAGAGECANFSSAPATKETTNLARIINFKLELEKKGRQPETIDTAYRRLLQLDKLCNINDPEEVRLTLARQKWAQNTKRGFVSIFDEYPKFQKIQWEKPIYRKERKIPFIPTEAEIDALIAASSKRMATLLQLLKETGARIGEAVKIEWSDIDFPRKLITVNHPEKGSLPRTLQISGKLTEMLNKLPRNKKTLFTTNKDSLRSNFDYMRKATADKLNNPRLLKIHFHTARFWKGTMDYHQLKDVKEVQARLGHVNSSSTDIYIQIDKTLFLQDTDQWVCKVAHNETEAIQLIEAGFTYVNNLGDTTALYRKRK